MKKKNQQQRLNTQKPLYMRKFFFLFSLHRTTVRVYKCWLLEYWTQALVRVNKFNECVLLLNLRFFFFFGVYFLVGST